MSLNDTDITNDLHSIDIMNDIGVPHVTDIINVFIIGKIIINKGLVW